MSAVLQRIAALANGLTKAELHILIELASRAQTPSQLEMRASSRELAQKTGVARASVQTAIDSLNKMQLIRSSSGNATQPAVHRLLCLEPVENPPDEATAVPEVAQTPGQAGLNTDPEVAQVLSQSGLTAGPVLAQILSQGGPITEPPEAQNLGQGGLKTKPGAA